MTEIAPRSLTAGVLLPGFVGTTLPAWVARRLEDGLAGVCLFGYNIVDLDQLRALTDDIVRHNPDALIAVDEEGGDVTRLFYGMGAPSPGNAWLGRFDDVYTTFAVAASIAEQLRQVGCNLNFAPSADVNSNNANPVIGVRSFGADPELVARHTDAWVRGHQSVGVAVSAKHFPGHGDTQTDSHLALPVVDAPFDVLRVRELAPFEAAVAAGAWTIMTSHIMLPALDETAPATFSSAILNGLLRQSLGFAGVVVSDALDMAGASGEIGIPEAAVRAIAGGCDLLCIGTANTDEQLDDIEAAIRDASSTGRLSSARLADAVERVSDLGARLRSLRADRPADLSLLTGGGQVAGLDSDVVAGAFDISAIGQRLLDQARDRGAGWDVVQLETVANVAVGTVPWGPAAAARQGEVSVVDRDTAESEPWVAARRAGPNPLVLVGRDNHRHPWVSRLVDEIRQSRPDVLVVDMGWPDDGRAYADIATFGGSRLIGASLLTLLSVGSRRLGVEAGDRL